MPAISVIMPVRNAAKTVEGAMASILGQTERDLELVAVDDGSTDRSGELLELEAGRDSRVKVLHLPHRGIVGALEAGLSMASGSLIARMDADDWSAPDRLEKQGRFLRENPSIGLVGCRVIYGGDAVKNAGYAIHVDWTNQLVTPEAIEANRFVESPLAHPSVMFRGELVHRFGGYRQGKFPEDYELWLRWLEAGVKFAKVPEPLLTWNDPPSRLSRNDERYSPSAFYGIKAAYLARWLAKRNPHHPRVMIIGSGRVTRRRVEVLTALGVEVVAYVDIDPKKVGRSHAGVPVLGVESLPPARQHFVLAYVGKRGARELIARWLQERGYILGRDWLPAA